MKTLNDKINALRVKEKNRLEAKLHEARGNYRDTGFNKYWNQINRLENQIANIDGMNTITKAEAEAIKAKHREHLQRIQRQAVELAAEEPLNIEFKHYCQWLDNYLGYIEREA